MLLFREIILLDISNIVFFILHVKIYTYILGMYMYICILFYALLPVFNNSFVKIFLVNTYRSI